MRAPGSVSPTVFVSSVKDRQTDRQASRRLNHLRSPCPPATRSERKTDREQEIKKREDPGVWESEMQRCKRRRGRSTIGLWLWSEQSFYADTGQTLVEVLISLGCLQEPLRACN